MRLLFGTANCEVNFEAITRDFSPAVSLYTSRGINCENSLHCSLIFSRESSCDYSRDKNNRELSLSILL